MTNRVPLAIADVELQLATAIAVGGTSFTLNSATDDDGNALPAGLYCFTIDSGTSNKEYLIGQLNGVNVTSVKSVSRQGAETTGAARAHRIGAPCIITNFATLQRVADILRGAVDLDGASPVSYDAEPTLADRKELATVGYVLDTVTGGTVNFDAQTTTATGGESIVAGDLVYFNTSDGKWYKTDADTASTVENVTLGIALGTGSNGVAITGGVLVNGIYTTTGLTANSLYYASNTAGAISTSAGTTKKVIGVALSTTRLFFYPSNNQTLTTREKDALVGDGATPSSSNPYTLRARSVTAGETINGATLPVPVFQNTSDNEFYACDANDNTRYKFLGFAVSNSTDGNSMNVQFSGVVSGFTGLAEGTSYYVQDTVGTIGTTPGTIEILVGVAISETQLLIQTGRRTKINGGSFADAGNAGQTQDVTVTTGFRPRVIRMRLTAAQAEASLSLGTWENGNYRATLVGVSSSTLAPSVYTDRIGESYSGSTQHWTVVVQSVNNTGYVIRATQAVNSPQTALYQLEAEGDI